MGVLIKNGTSVTAENEFRGDVYIAGEKIIAIGGKLGNRPEDEVIEEIPKLAEAGYPTMKLFMAYK